MLISGKGKYFSVFGCISKNFPENIFWRLEKKKENTNPEKHKPQPRKNHQRRQVIAIDGAIAIAISPSSRDCDRREIAINGVISPSIDRDLGSSSLAVDRDGEIVINGAISPSNASPLARAHALSLSLSFSRNALKGK